MLRRTEGSSKEEQIYQKEQILAELQVGSNKFWIILLMSAECFMTCVYTHNCPNFFVNV